MIRREGSTKEVRKGEKRIKRAKARYVQNPPRRIESIDERAQKNDWIIAGQDEMWKRRVRPEGPYQENRYAKDDAP